MVKEFDRVCEVQSDKASIEITSRYAGRIARVHHPVGSMVKVGAPLVDIHLHGTNGSASAGQAAAAAGSPSDEANAGNKPGCTASGAASGSGTPAQPDAAAVVHSAAGDAYPGAAGPRSAAAARNGPVLASPAVRAMARESAVDLMAVPGTGPDGRVTKHDLMQWLGTIDTTTGGKGGQGDVRTGPSAPPTQATQAAAALPVEAALGAMAAEAQGTETRVQLRGYKRCGIG